MSVSLSLSLSLNLSLYLPVLSAYDLFLLQVIVHFLLCLLQSLKSYFLLCLVTVIFFVTIYILLCPVTEFPPDTWAFPMTRAYELLNSRGEVEDWYPLSTDWLNGSLVIGPRWIGMRVIFPLVP